MSKNYKDLEEMKAGFSLCLYVLVWEIAGSVKNISPLGECLTQYMSYHFCSPARETELRLV